jgi:hypothetical protein
MELANFLFDLWYLGVFLRGIWFLRLKLLNFWTNCSYLSFNLLPLTFISLAVFNLSGPCDTSKIICSPEYDAKLGVYIRDYFD